MKTIVRRIGWLIATGLCAVLAGPAAADKALLDEACGGCHEADANGALSRIVGQRKTPEAWLMTIVRMRLIHGVNVPAETQAKLVRYLSDTQGLAPSETTGYRYILEREPAVVEAFDQLTAEICGRCHSGARVALQRRTAEEWLLHVDFHVGQYPTIEYQAMGRDREWYKIAKEQVAPKLAETYPFETDAWSNWQAAAKPDARGDWIFITSLPGVGETFGRLTVSGDNQPYTVIGSVVAQNGVWTPIQGKLNVYTGFEWRASVAIGGESFRQVLALSADGSELSGRLFRSDDDALGGSFKAVRAGAGSKVVGTVPSAVPAGSRAKVQVVGTNIGGPTMSEGVAAINVGPNAYGIELLIESAPGSNGTISVGGAEWQTGFTVYSGVDSVKVEPAFNIARVGGGGGHTAPVKAMFRAIGFWNGPDGKPGTDDDIRIGDVPANWMVEPFDDTAKQLEDVKFAGQMDAGSGIFTPAVAGPNPERPFSTNNAGNLKVVADHNGTKGEGQLIVTVQRWNDPPIR